MKNIFLLLALALTGGCCSTVFAPPGYKYTGELPCKIDVTETVARDFAAKLAADAGLKIVDPGEASAAATGPHPTIVRLKRDGNETGFIEVRDYPWKRTLMVRIGGGIDPKEAERIGRAAMKLYERTYPFHRLKLDDPYAGFLVDSNLTQPQKLLAGSPPVWQGGGNVIITLPGGAGPWGGWGWHP